MLKYFLVILIMLQGPLCAKAQTFTELLQAGKDSLRKERARVAGEKCDYSAAIKILETAAAMRPDDQEVHYFLGSAYDYDNGSFVDALRQRTLEKTRRTSAEFEKVIKISPAYRGELIALDPYAKLTSIGAVLHLGAW